MSIAKSKKMELLKRIKALRSVGVQAGHFNTLERLSTPKKSCASRSKMMMFLLVSLALAFHLVAFVSRSDIVRATSRSLNFFKRGKSLRKE